MIPILPKLIAGLAIDLCAMFKLPQARDGFTSRTLTSDRA